MKDQEFIELLNLYLDHEITPADARRLEAEVRANPARRQIYVEYCQMQKACNLMADQFGSNRASAPARIAARRPSQRAVVIAFGSFAALAACVALVLFFGARRRTAPATPAEAVAAATVEPQRASVMLASLSASDLRSPLSQESTSSSVAADGLEWVRSFQVNAAPGLAEPVRFEPTPDLFRHELRAVPTTATQPPAAESAAFRFQR